MEQRMMIPRDLKLVANIFIFFGVLAVIDVFVSLLDGRLNINFSVLEIPIGIGLINLRRGWYTCALVFLVLGLVLIPTICLGLVFHVATFDFKVFGQRVGDVPKVIVFAFAAVAFSLMLWQYRVLTRPTTRQLFEIGVKGSA